MAKNIIPVGYDSTTGQDVVYETNDTFFPHLGTFASTTSAQLAGVISDETGSGSLVFATSPTLVTPVLGSASVTNMTFSTGGAIRTATVANDTLLFQAYDTDGVSYTTFATLTAGVTPTFDLADSVTKSGQYIYRAAGTDVSVTDGGTGVSSLTAYAPIFGGTTSTGAVQSGTTGTLGQVLTSNGPGALPTFQDKNIYAYTTKTANYTITDSDYTIDCTSGAFTVTLPTAVGRIGKVFVVKRTSTGLITLVPNGSELIDGASGVTIAPRYTSITVQSTGSGWIII